ncbi:MAG TPA: class I SAM-dependent DNA methyltransferase [Candidatus Thermoplasmatota archaeon]|nr:class I SAM-dependent DNA methyltransferase [Candidatus Thermoplasmatota archaeon]
MGAEGTAAPAKAVPVSTSGATLGFEARLWEAADKMRNNVDPSEYKHVVLGLIFLKYINDAFQERRDHLAAAAKDPASEYYAPRPADVEALLEEKDEYLGWNVFWVPPEARWDRLQAQAKQPTIGKLVDDAMVAIERDNPTLKGVLPKDYARPTLDKQVLGGLIDLVGGIGLGTREARSKDILGRVYEYFLGRFASAEGKGGGEFYTPASVVTLLVEMLEPYAGRVFDPCCGSGGMFVQSAKFVEAHGGKRDAISVYGQESNPTTWRLAKMNLAIRGIEAHLGETFADSFTNDQHKDLRADYILANPPFNISDWKGDLLREDVRWKYGVPPVRNANFAWVQHFIHHLAPNGTAGFVLANGSMSSNTGGEGEIRRRIVEDDLVDCMVALPGQLFYSTQIPVCLWFLTRNKGARRLPGDGNLRDRRGQTLFIDARKMGHLVDRTHRELSTQDIAQIAKTYHAWRGEAGAGEYVDVPGFCRGADLEEIRQHGFVLTPGRYVGADDQNDDGSEPFAERFECLRETLLKQMQAAADLDQEIKTRLAQITQGE